MLVAPEDVHVALVLWDDDKVRVVPVKSQDIVTHVFSGIVQAVVVVSSPGPEENDMEAYCYVW